MRRDLGRFGEFLTYRYLRKHEKEGAKFLFNLYIPKGEDGTTEIDVLMISPKGLFVFESKNYSGWIFGSEHQPKWYQTLPQGRGKSHKEAFYNPIMQNKTHIKHLKAMLGETIPMHSIITFSDRCTLKNVQVKSTDIHVINRNEVVGVVATIASRQPDILTSAQIQEIHDLLYPYTQTDDAVKQKHIERIEQAIHSDPEEPTVTAAPISPLQQTPSEVPTVQETSTEVPTTQEISTEVPDILPEPKTTPLHCPKCGAELVLRTAKKGSNAGNQFYGCSNFPKCRYIQSV
jgi:predicted RNA-binding Zn-ribbon protein involved in translation (DUF1610 family)